MPELCPKEIASLDGAPCAKQKEGGKAETRVTVRAKLNSNRRRLSNKSSRGVSRGIRREKGGKLELSANNLGNAAAVKLHLTTSLSSLLTSWIRERNTGLG